MLNQLSGEHLNEVAFPLGGIGTGTISLGGRAELRDIEIFNQPAKGLNLPYTFFSLWLQAENQEPIARVLEGALQPPYSGSFGVQASVAGLPRMKHVSLQATYPCARYTLRDPDVPIEITLDALNPLIPHDVERSSLPVAILRYTLHNPTNQPYQAAISGSLYNAIGMEIGRPDGSTSSYAAKGVGKVLGGNLNEIRTHATADGQKVHGLLMRSTRVEPRTPQDGTLSLAVLADEASFMPDWGKIYGTWNRHILKFWDDFRLDGHLDGEPPAAPSAEDEGMVGSVATPLTLAPGGTIHCTYIIAWHFPHRTAAGCGWATDDPEGGYIGNAYTHGYTDAWDVVRQVAPQLDDLEQQTKRFTAAIETSTLPHAVRDAALNNTSTLRSPTCFRTADGNFFGFEGYHDTLGCCFGSCTHVWNYEQTTPFLFPTLARNMRQLELEHGTFESGLNTFRLKLPLGNDSPYAYAAADGQMGVVMKCYREWQLGAGQDFLQTHWAKIKSLITYCWLPGSWDADQDGVMEGVQHNTYDVEFFGPNPLCTVWYLGALRAAEEMAIAVEDSTFAHRCRELYTRGSAWTEENLFNGEYYIQQVKPPVKLEDTRRELRIGMGETDLADPDFQVGAGCLIDQLVGQYMAHCVGLGHLLDRQQQQRALDALYRHNFRADLSDHWNTMRTYALGDEQALLICSWPQGNRPAVPFPYFSEVMTGFEYQAAVHMIYEGLIEQGLSIIEAIRDRFDGRRRNPWNEQECGHHYARAMAAWAAIPALSGFHYSAIDQLLRFQPRWQPKAFHSIWMSGTAWGSVEQADQQNGSGQTTRSITLRVESGRLPVRRLVLQPPATQGETHAITIAHTDDNASSPRAVEYTGESAGDGLGIVLAHPLELDSGAILQIQIAAPNP